jgi:hypothetical protein
VVHGGVHAKEIRHLIKEPSRHCTSHEWNEIDQEGHAEDLLVPSDRLDDAIGDVVGLQERHQEREADFDTIEHARIDVRWVHDRCLHTIDTLALELHTQGLVETERSPFARSVISQSSDANHAAGARDGYHVPVISLDHSRQERPHCPKVCHSVNLKGLCNRTFAVFQQGLSGHCNEFTVSDASIKFLSSFESNLAPLRAK